MKLLLDTHILLWLVFDDRRLHPAVRDTIAAADIHVSAVSVVEVSIKTALGKLVIDPDLWDRLHESGVTALPITWDHAQVVRALPLHHRDPFDRLLVAQAQVEGLTLVTADAAVKRYDVALMPI